MILSLSLQLKAGLFVAGVTTNLNEAQLTLRRFLRASWKVGLFLIFFFDFREDQIYLKNRADCHVLHVTTVKALHSVGTQAVVHLNNIKAFP